MALDENRRIVLYNAAVQSWGEEAAGILVELVAPSGQELATRADVQGVLIAMDAMDERWTERIAAMDERWSGRLAAMDERWSGRLAAMDARLDAMDERWSGRLAAMDVRLDAMDGRLAAMDTRWSERLDAMDERWSERLGAMEHRLTGSFERGLREAITSQTRALVVSLLVSVVAIAGVAFGLAG